jgi:hypothetical protein
MENVYDITLIQGDSYKWAMFLTDVGGTAYNLGGCTLSMQVRKGYYPTSLIASYSTYIPVGSLVAGMPEGIVGGISAAATGGTIYISLGATYTSNLPPGSNNKYDIQLHNPTGNVISTLLRGSIDVINEVTRL